MCIEYPVARKYWQVNLYRTTKMLNMSNIILVETIAAVLLVVALSTERWATGRILCKTGAEIVNASHPELEQFIGDIYYGLFRGGKTKRCGLGKRRSKIHSKTFIQSSFFYYEANVIMCHKSTDIVQVIYYIFL